MPVSEPDVETSPRIDEEWKNVMATELNRLASLAIGANCLAPPRPQLQYLMYVPYVLPMRDYYFDPLLFCQNSFQ